ncbi:late embryogenesis abundant protein, group 3-like [Gossypium australe]|uniref:Late embryogenesis abundant protein, group 3-like n=1 Tax=Gossypium australe TaxID=47621 RepID=A0A5B6XBN7_9ROSI|nr:late embryogenesis abundant protein, group 3-like [Gossypium australe]
MAMLNLVNSPFCISNSGGGVVRNRVLPPATPTFIHESKAFDTAKGTIKGVNETKEATKNMKDSTISAASQVNQKAQETIKQGANQAADATKNMKDKTTSAASQVSEKAKGMAEKATDAAKQVWDTAIETAQKAKETVLGKADESKGGIKENAEKIKQRMNDKN